MILPTSSTLGSSSRENAAYDAELVRRFKENGDEAAFAEIYRRYWNKMLQVSYGLLCNQGDAEEIAQDTFIRAHRGLANFRGDSSLATWLHRIAINLSRNRFWFFYRRCRDKHYGLDAPISQNCVTTQADLLASEQLDPLAQVDYDELAEAIDSRTKKLRHTHREILVLRNVLHKSYLEIAEILGITEGTVKSRIARARESLRDLLGEERLGGLD